MGRSSGILHGFFGTSSGLFWHHQGVMNSVDEAWLSLLLLALFGLLLFLRIKFPDVSRGRETAVLVVATILFFSICNLFMGSSTATIQKLSAAQASVLEP